MLPVFVNIFILTLSGALLAMHFTERRARGQITRFLESGTIQPPAAVALLRQAEANAAVVQEQPLFGALLQRMDDLLQQSEVGWTRKRLLTLMLSMGMIGALVGFVFPMLMNQMTSVIGLGGAGLALPLLYLRRARTKRLDGLERQLPDAMDFLARSMRAGHAFTISIGMVGDELPDPLGKEFRSLFNEQNLGAPLDEAFAGFLKRVPTVDAKLFCSAAILQRRTGGNLSDLLGRLAEIIRDRFRLRGQVKAASAHARMTAGVLTAMPALTMVAFMMVAPNYLSGLWRDPDGRQLVYIAIAAQLLGRFVINKIITVKV